MACIRAGNPRGIGFHKDRMRLLGLRLSSFRNLKNLELEPGGKFNVFYGNNGQGKTNLLESIYLLSTMKSFKSAKNMELITFGADFSLIRGVVEKDCVKRDISLLLEKQGKKGKVDGKLATRVDDFFGNLNVVVFTPEEISMVRGAPELRRRYLDRAVFTGDLGYLGLFHDYTKILKNRNAMLSGATSRGSRCGASSWPMRRGTWWPGALLSYGDAGSFAVFLPPNLRQRRGGGTLLPSEPHG